jgi:hypothetical protein
MKWFWVVIGLALVGAWVGLEYLPKPRVQLVEYVPPPAFERMVVHLAPALLIAVIWAIIFRPQIEKMRFSLFSIFVLATMEAVWLCLHRALFEH